MPSHSDPASCHHTSSSSQRTSRGAYLAIRHHAITRSDSGAKGSRLDGQASCLRASPSLPLKATLGRSSPHALAPSSFPSLSIKIGEPGRSSGSLAFVPSHLLRTRFMHAQVVIPTLLSAITCSAHVVMLCVVAFMALGASEGQCPLILSDTS